jgi:hypothetical protein
MEMASLMSILRRSRALAVALSQAISVPVHDDHPAFARYSQVVRLVYARINGDITRQQFDQEFENRLSLD